MDLGVIRGIGTAILFASFLGLILWAWAPAQRRRFEEAARLPFLDEEPDPNPEPRAAVKGGGA